MSQKKSHLEEFSRVLNTKDMIFSPHHNLVPEFTLITTFVTTWDSTFKQVVVFFTVSIPIQSFEGRTSLIRNNALRTTSL